jgi:hypothetical protein
MNSKVRLGFAERPVWAAQWRVRTRVIIQRSVTPTDTPTIALTMPRTAAPPPHVPVQVSDDCEANVQEMAASGTNHQARR